jgi:hypothetical protein
MSGFDNGGHMKTLHHTYVKKAAKMGVQLTLENNRIRAFWPERNFELFAADGKEAIELIQQAQNMAYQDDLPEGDDGFSQNESSRGLWERTGKRVVEPKFAEDPAHTIEGVPTNGKQAFHKGFMAGDCPFAEDDPRFEQWNSEFDAAIEGENGELAEPEDKPPASVVKPKYRAIYAERGTPTTCNDELAQKLDNLVKNAKGTNIEYFDAILKVNEVDMTKYSKTTPGWQGRYRMTGRNMLAKKVHANGGVLLIPGMTSDVTIEVQMSSEWMASQRFQK